MIRLLLGAAALLLAASPAFAFCPALPDGPASYNVQNGTALALCQQAELAGEAVRLRQESAYRGMLQTLELQQLELRQRPLPSPAPVF